MKENREGDDDDHAHEDDNGEEEGEGETAVAGTSAAFQSYALDPRDIKGMRASLYECTVVDPDVVVVSRGQ